MIFLEEEEEEEEEEEVVVVVVVVVVMLLKSLDNVKRMSFDFLFENSSVTTPETKKNFWGVGFRDSRVSGSL